MMKNVSLYPKKTTVSYFDYNGNRVDEEKIDENSMKQTIKTWRTIAFIIAVVMTAVVFVSLVLNANPVPKIAWFHIVLLVPSCVIFGYLLATNSTGGTDLCSH